MLIGLSFLGFISLGLPDGLLGVAWPSMRQSFGTPLDALGALLLTTAAGYLLSSLSSGWVLDRLGVGGLLALSGFLTAVGLLGYAIAPAWWLMVWLGLLAGMGAGAIDAGLNTYAAIHHSPRFLNWLHASYGLGAAGGPAIMMAVLGAGQPWRLGYLIVGLLQALLGTCFLLTSPRWRMPEPAVRPLPDSPEPAADLVSTLRLPLVWLSVALFLVYTGIEASAGQWSYTLFTEGRSAAPQVAGLWVSIYWGSLAGGRVLFGFLANRVDPVWLLRAAMLGVLSGSALVWLNPSETLAFLGLGLMGLASAPIFPSLISTTPQRLGPERAGVVVGFQVGAASLGIALLPGLAGLLAERLSLEIIPPSLVLASLLMLALHEALAGRSSG